jgi:diguanylate cyclase (GGDEF)-like protein
MSTEPGEPGFDAAERAEELLDHLHRRERELLRLATTDPLTGLPNRRALFEALEAEVLRSRRYGHPLALLMIDVDGLREVNNARGHPAGDRLLAAVAAVLREGVREVDLPARYGGDEFAVLLPETPLPGAMVAAERLRAAVEAADLGDGAGLTLSLGVAAAPPLDRDVEGLLAEADAALYRAKNAGGNRVAGA